MSTTYTIKQGDTLAAIAKQHGFNNWQTLYRHEDNAEFRKKRPNPNVINPGDEIQIPDKEEKSVILETGKRHVFKLCPKKDDKLRYVIDGAYRDYTAGKKYILVIDGEEIEGTVGDDGAIECDCPAGAEVGELRLWLEEESEPSHVFDIKLGFLDTVSETTGIQARMNNLGYDCGAVDGDIGPKMKKAVEQFQAHHNLKVDGNPAEITQKQLESIYGS